MVFFAFWDCGKYLEFRSEVCCKGVYFLTLGCGVVEHGISAKMLLRLVLILGPIKLRLVPAEFCYWSEKRPKC